MGRLAPKAPMGEKIKTIIAQLEAASTLLKFAADDMLELAAHENAPLCDALSQIALGLRKSATSVLENALYLDRIESDDDSDESLPGKNHHYGRKMRSA